MADENFHEIQLSGKQLIFLFMATVVLAVIVFLLGVSVGRGVRATAPQTAAADAGLAPIGAPPPTQPAPGDLDYHEKLVGRGAPDAAKPTANPPGANPPATNSAQAPPPAAAPPQSSPAASSTAKSAPAPTPPPAATPPTVNGGWKVQVGAFNSKSNAEAQVGKLKAKGYAAFLFNAPPPSLPYHVRVGPFAQRADAVKVVNELTKEGIQAPKVIR